MRIPSCLKISAGKTSLQTMPIWLAYADRTSTSEFSDPLRVRMRDGYSATEAEFREAERQGLRLCVFVTGVDGIDMDGAQRDLITGIRNGYTTSTFASPDSLKNRIATRLHTMAEEDLLHGFVLGT